MPAMKLSRSVWASLAKVIKGPCLATDIPDSDIEMLVGCGLIKRDVMLVHATALGQVELLRQRFKGDKSLAAYAR